MRAQCPASMPLFPKAAGNLLASLPLGSLDHCGFGLQDMASSSVVIEKHNYLSPSPAS